MQSRATSGSVPIQRAAAVTKDGQEVEFLASPSGSTVADTDFRPSVYAADLTMNGTAQAVAIASGATKLRVSNRGATLKAIRLAFGTSASEAQANLTIVSAAATTGMYIFAPADGFQGSQIIGIPSLATHFAVANAVAADVQVVSIEQGA